MKKHTTFHAWTREKGAKTEYVSSYFVAQNAQNARVAFAALRDLDPESPVTRAKNQANEGLPVEFAYPELF